MGAVLSNTSGRFTFNSSHLVRTPINPYTSFSVGAGFNPTPMRPLGISPAYIRTVAGGAVVMFLSLGPGTFLSCELCDAKIKVQRP